MVSKIERIIACIKRIIACVLLVISIPFCIVAFADFTKTKDDVDIFLFFLSFFVFIIGVYLFISGKSKKENEITQTELPQYTESYSTSAEVEKETHINYDLMEGHEFEYFCADLLRKNGFHDVEVTRGSGDQGIDVIAYKDGMKYGVQCKCYGSDIGNKAVQEAFSGKTFYDCHVAAVLTNRYFTKSAKELSNMNKVLLWDRDVLNKFIERSED